MLQYNISGSFRYIWAAQFLLLSKESQLRIFNNFCDFILIPIYIWLFVNFQFCATFLMAHVMARTCQCHETLSRQPLLLHPCQSYLHQFITFIITPCFSPNTIGSPEIHHFFSLLLSSSCNIHKGCSPSCHQNHGFSG